VQKPSKGDVRGKPEAGAAATVPRGGMSFAIITIMEALLILVLLGGFVAALGSIVLLSRHFATQTPFAPVQVHPIPLRRRTVLFSKAERSFYQGLRSLVPDHMIFVKVKLADLVSLKPRDSFWEHFSAINRKYIDFVVCDPTLSPVLAIELDAVHSSASDRSTIDQVKAMLAAEALPIVHIPQKRQYLFNELRRLLTPYLSVARPML
jgi:hypothetical protein